MQTLEQFCVDSLMCFLIAQIFYDSVTTIQMLIAVEVVGKQFDCFRDNIRLWILVSFSMGIHSRLHKINETINWNILHEAIIF